MVEPTLRTTSSPLDRYTLAELRDHIAISRQGRAYADLNTEWQTEVNAQIQSAYEYCSQRLGHITHGQRQTTISLAAGEAKYAMPADYRQVRHVLEGTGDNMRQALVVDQDDYWNSFPPTRAGTGVSHPWNDQDEPRWFFVGFDDSNPPVATLQRVPTPTSAEAGTDNVTIVYRPYMEITTTSTYNELPPAMREAMAAQVRYMISTISGNQQQAAADRAVREDHIEANLVNDHKEHEKPLYLRLPDATMHELDMYDWR